MKIVEKRVYMAESSSSEARVKQEGPDLVSPVSSLEEAYRAHATLLYRYAVAILGTEGDAEDALHAVFLRLASKPFPNVRDVRAYLLRAVRNECRTRGRRRRRHRTLPLLEDPPGRDPGSAEEINRALARVSRKFREVVVLRVYDGMTFEHIAEAIGSSATTARERYKRALDELRKLLEA